MSHANEIDLKSLTELFTNKVAENKNLEYKALLSIDKLSERKEFLYDVSSFANSYGGLIIFGISESQGIPTQMDGFPVSNKDAFLLKADNLIRDGIQPRIIGIDNQIFDLPNGNIILTMQIPASSYGPHQVTLDGAGKFYTRSTAGKYIMDHNEIRVAIEANQRLVRKINELQQDRLHKVMKDETPVNLFPSAKVILQVIPEDSFRSKAELILNDPKYDIASLRPLGGGNRDISYNLEGFLTNSRPPGAIHDAAYLQVYRNGVIETVNSLILFHRGGPPLLQVRLIEGYVMRETQTYLKWLTDAGYNCPVHLYLTLSNVKGYMLYSENAGHSFNARAIQQENIELSELTVQSYADPKPSLLSWFDRIWNACGYPRSYDFTDGGAWKSSL